MELAVKNDILIVLRKSLPMIKDGDSSGLKELSNHTIHNASIFQDEDSITVAVLVYSLSKIIGRARLDTKKITGLVENAANELEAKQFGRFRLALKKLIETISLIDSELKLYIEQVINQAQIKKGSAIYRHGVSIARVSSMLGISQWELMSYVGKTNISEDFPAGINAASRIKFSRGLFGL